MQVEPFVTAIELAAATVYTWVASVVSKNTHKNVDKYYQVLVVLGQSRYKVDKNFMCGHPYWESMIFLKIAIGMQVIVISRARGMYGIYCTEARGRFAPEG